MFRLVGDLLSPAGPRAKLGILAYHRALSAPDPILHDEIHAGALEAHMTMLAEDFNVMPLGEACRLLAHGELPSRAVCVTFDDGYADNERVALPILKRLALTATFFVSTGYSGGAVMFNDVLIEACRHAVTGTYDLSRLGLGIYVLDDNASRRAAVDKMIAELKYRPFGNRKALAEQVADELRAPLPKNLMMSPEQIKRLHNAGMEIGGHTVNHPILTQVTDEEARAEIIDNKRTLEEITGAAVTVFAYPNGRPGRDYGPQHTRLVREAGFSAAVSSIGGVAHRDSDLYQLPRFSPWDKNVLRLGLRLLVTGRQSAMA